MGVGVLLRRVLGGVRRATEEFAHRGDEGTSSGSEMDASEGAREARRGRAAAPRIPTRGATGAARRGVERRHARLASTRGCATSDAARTAPRTRDLERDDMPFQIYVAGQRLASDAVLSDAWRASDARARLKRPSATDADGDDSDGDGRDRGTRDDGARAKRAAR